MVSCSSKLNIRNSEVFIPIVNRIFEKQTMSTLTKLLDTKIYWSCSENTLPRINVYKMVNDRNYVRIHEYQTRAN